MKTKRKISSISIRPAANSGHTVSTAYDNDGDGGYMTPVDHVFGRGQHHEMMNHVASSLGIGEGGESEADEAAESPAVKKAEAKAGTEKHKAHFPMKGRASLAMHMVRRAEATSKAKAKKV